MLLLLLILACGCATPALDRPVELKTEHVPSYDSLHKRLESLRQKYKVPGMAAAVAQDGHIIWSSGFGHANIEKNTPVITNTVFHLASLTKPFAATVIIQLVQEGKLSLDLPLSEFVDKVPASNGPVLVKHILSHTSEEIPGTSYKYNGARFRYLDDVIEKITGKPAARAIYERILLPLNLTNTAPNPQDLESCVLAGRDPAVFQARLAQGYHSNGKRPIPYPARFTSAAGLVSTVGDLVRFSAALDENELLQPASREQMFTPFTSNDGKSLPYGYGWFIYEGSVDQSGSDKYIWHYGWWEGNSSLIIKIPARKQTFVLLANSDQLSRPFNLGGDANLFKSAFAQAFIEKINGR
jgi:CubicO group peptidase (beta-lactamase class C family)